MKLLYSFNPERLFFKTMKRFFDILIGCFAIFLSSLLMNIENRNPSHGLFRLVLQESLDHISRQSTKFSYIINSFKEDVFVQKRRRFFCNQSSANILRLWVTTCQVISTPRKLKMPAVNGNTKASCAVSEILLKNIFCL